MSKLLKSSLATASAFVFTAGTASAQSGGSGFWHWWWGWWGGWSNPGNSTPPQSSVPEIDASTGGLALAAVCAALFLAWEMNRRRRKG